MQAFQNAPVEIWQNIIHHVLYDPIAFLDDPYYPGCNLHTAYNEWTDGKRLCKLEAQRGTLRLVSRSWKVLADLHQWRYFQPVRCKDMSQQLEWALSTRRLDFYCLCSGGGRVRESRVSDAFHTCPRHKESWISQYQRENPELCSATFDLATIVHIQDSLELDFAIQDTPIKNFFPRLRALSVGEYNAPQKHLLGVSTTLTFFSIRLVPEHYKERYEKPLKFPVLRTLHVEVDEEQNFDSLIQWKMPLLAHAELTVPSVEQYDLRATFFKHIGKNLVRLSLRTYEKSHLHPERYWEWMPKLEYISVTRLTLKWGFYPLPPDYPLRTFGLVEESVPNVAWSRRNTGTIAEKWKTISTIADCHSWEDLTKWLKVTFPDKPPDLDKLTKGYEHEHRGVHCWECIHLLLWKCKKNGLRYEDITGRTWAEYFHAKGVRL
ncbi:hypothetical protein M408DRAFT_26483 [Serendipita vermifera MAFF 305830]|uniref:F-box domain-containing protein n=1 Tax=Serendipita vermifera MAFF 305830 TaxID=933852 RepID=A0A0C3AYL8_SERVB|nr:hypothetical protein M408DRAFT_26483 [Serendipita vermifera MAFF 305830]